MKKKKVLNLLLTLALCFSMALGNAVTTNAAVKDNVGGMDTSVDASDTDSNGNKPTNGNASAGTILKGYGAWVDGDLVVGTIPNITATTYYPTTTEQKINKNQYINQDITIKPVVINKQNLDANKILAGTSIQVSDGNGTNFVNVTGSMANNGSVSQSLNAGGSYKIPKGYHDGTGTITANSLASQTSGTATVNDILSNKTAWVNGAKVTGNIPTKTANDLSASGATVSVPKGYYASDVSKSVATTTQATPSISIGTDGKITASATQTEGYVTAGTKSATKPMTVASADKTTLKAGETAKIAKGAYVTNDITITANSLASQTGVDSGKTAATASQMLTGYQAWVNGTQVTGNMTNKANSTTAATTITESGTDALITIPAAGYYDTNSKISVPIETIKNNVSSLKQQLFNL